MVEPRRRTRSRRKVRRATPGGGRVTHYRRKKSGKARCGRCGGALSGVASGNPTEVRRLSGSGRLPARPYAGVLCPNCLDSLIRYATRMEVKHRVEGYGDLKVQRDLTLEKFLPRGWWGMVSAGDVPHRKAREKPVWGKGAKAGDEAKPKRKARKKAR